MYGRHSPVHATYILLWFGYNLIRRNVERIITIKFIKCYIFRMIPSTNNNASMVHVQINIVTQYNFQNFQNGHIL